MMTIFLANREKILVLEEDRPLMSPRIGEFVTFNKKNYRINDVKWEFTEVPSTKKLTTTLYVNLMEVLDL